MHTKELGQHHSCIEVSPSTHVVNDVHALVGNCVGLCVGGVGDGVGTGIAGHPSALKVSDVWISLDAYFFNGSVTASKFCTFWSCAEENDGDDDDATTTRRRKKFIFHLTLWINLSTTSHHR